MRIYKPVIVRRIFNYNFCMHDESSFYFLPICLVPTNIVIHVKVYYFFNTHRFSRDCTLSNDRKHFSNSIKPLNVTWNIAFKYNDYNLQKIKKISVVIYEKSDRPFDPRRIHAVKCFCFLIIFFLIFSFLFNMLFVIHLKPEYVTTHVANCSLNANLPTW